jgi:hypothetical protein
VRDERLIDALAAVFAQLGKYDFRWRVDGLDRIPASGGALLVGNHGGGVMTMDAYLAAAAICERWGAGRAVHPLVHDFALVDLVLRRVLPRLGALRASGSEATRARRRPSGPGLSRR